MALESAYATGLIKRLRQQYPGIVILKNNANYMPGVPDRLLLFEDKWAMLETKRGLKARHEPNQDWYVDLFNEMSFGAFINPTNEREVLSGLQQTFQPKRKTRNSRA